MSDETRILIKDVRVSFPVHDEPKEYTKGDGKPRYSLLPILPNGSPQLKQVLKAMRTAAAEKWGEAKADAAVKSLMAANKTCLTDGALKAEKYEGFEDCMVLAVHTPAKTPPSLYDASKNKLPMTNGVIYSGCYCDVLVSIYADSRFGNRINAKYLGAMFRRAGDFMGGHRAASEDEFETLEGEDVEDSIALDFA